MSGRSLTGDQKTNRQVNHHFPLKQLCHIKALYNIAATQSPSKYCFYLVRLQKRQRQEKQQAAFSRLDDDEDPAPSRAARLAAAGGARLAAAGSARAPSKGGVSRLPPPKVLPAGNTKQLGRTMLMINFPEVCAFTPTCLPQ